MSAPRRHYQKELPFLLRAERRDSSIGLSATVLFTLGLAHARGVGVAQDLALARRLQKQAAKLGLAEAKLELARLERTSRRSRGKPR